MNFYRAVTAGAAVLLGLAALTSCSSGSTGSSTSKASEVVVPSAAPASSTPPVVPPPGSSGAPASSHAPTASRTAAASRSAAGCPATPGGIPQGAATRQIIDVDGDGKPDTGWATDNNQRVSRSIWTFGFTTASRATSSVGFSVAGGTSADALFVNVDNQGTIAVLIGNDRGESLYVVSGCKLVEATDQQGQQYRFQTYGYGTGTGTGVGCSTVKGANGQTLVGLNILDSHGKSPTINDSGGTPATVTRTQVLVSGTHAKNGVSDSVAVSGKDDPALKSAEEVSCGKLTESKDAVVPPTS